MIDSPDISGAIRSRRSRHVLVGFLGSVVRRMGNWMPVAGSVELMRQLGLDESSVRTSIFRLKKRGWLAQETRAGAKGYRLTDEALRALGEGDEVIWHARQPATLSDGWCFINSSVPESSRALRHQLRSHLTTLGFGNVGSGVWIAPARMQAAARRTIETLGLTEQSVIFVGSHAGGQDLRALVSSSWDLDELNSRYREFVGLHRGPADLLDLTGVLDGEAAFVAYVTLIDDWRQLPFRDPGLPRELLGAGWAAAEAAALFERMVATLEGRALAHAASFWPVSR